MEQVPHHWQSIIKGQWEKSRVLLAALFSHDGSLIYANDGMHSLMHAAGMSHDPCGIMRNPSFDDLRACPPAEDPVFEGILTMGNGRDVNHSFIACAYRHDDEILVTGEYDAGQLDFLNSELSSMNREINTLQRELIKEKKTLQAALEELKKTQAMLVHSEKMSALGRLTAGMAHEINNPLSFISSNMVTLGNYMKDLESAFAAVEEAAAGAPAFLASSIENIKRHHDIAYIFEDSRDLHRGTIDGLARVKKIIDDLRRFSRLDEAACKEVDLLETLQATVTLVAPELRRREITLTIDSDPMGPVECCPAELNQVFLNLLVNSLQAIGRNGTITIGMKKNGESITMTFSDTGKGISPEIMARIFDPFFTTRPPGQGTGLGLSIASKIVQDLHHGTIECESEVDRGTTFTITIPPRRNTPDDHE